MRRTERGEKIRAESENRQNTQQQSLHSIPLRRQAVAINSAQPQKKADKTCITHELGISLTVLHTVMDDEPLYRRVVCLLPKRSVGGARVCARQAEKGGQRRRFGTSGEERSLVAERSAPGCGNIRLQTAEQRRAVQPGRGAPGLHTAPAVTHSLPRRRCGWVHCFCKRREGSSSSVQCVCVRVGVCV